MNSEYIIIAVIIVLILFFLYNDNNKLKEEYKPMASKRISYPYNDDGKYLYEYDWVFGGWPNWYNRFTPLPFNNPTRYYGYKTTLYPLIQDYYYPRLRYY